MKNNNMLFVIVEVRGRQLLEEQNSDDSYEIDRMSRKWYSACLNESRIEELGVFPMLDTLEKLNGWPVLEESDEKYESFKWYEQNKKIECRRSFNKYSFVTLYFC